MLCCTQCGPPDQGCCRYPQDVKGAEIEIQECGGTITAKNVRNLTIPLSPFITGRGVGGGARHGARRDRVAESYGYRSTFVSVQLIFGTRDHGVAEPLFKLQPSVTLPARPDAAPAAEEIAPEFESQMVRAMESLLNQAPPNDAGGWQRPRHESALAPKRTIASPSAASRSKQSARHMPLALAVQVTVGYVAGKMAAERPVLPMAGSIAERHDATATHDKIPVQKRILAYFFAAKLGR